MKQARTSEDRISSLPGDVIESILERLSFEEAARTSILSRTWRYKCRALSKITFNSDFADETKLETAIYQILVLHTSKIRKFHLYMPRDLRRVPNILLLMYHLSTNGIKDLSISSNDVHPVVVLPSYLFSCPELTHLCISLCLFRPPPDFSGFSCLVSLICWHTEFRDVTFESFLPSSPLLENLSLNTCPGIGRLVIDAPTLKHLSIYRCFDIEFLCFMNMDNVTTACIQVHGCLKKTDQSQTMLSVFTAFTKIEKLNLGDFGESYFKLLAAGGVPFCLPNSLYHLKFLSLDFISFFNTYQISCALCLIRSCPNLQELHILGTESDDDDMSSMTSYLEEQALDSHASLLQLQKISIDNLRGVNPELEIIKFLLASSPKLKSLSVSFEADAADGVMLRVTVELLSYQRVSAQARVIVNTAS